VRLTGASGPSQWIVTVERAIRARAAHDIAEAPQQRGVDDSVGLVAVVVDAAAAADDVRRPRRIASRWGGTRVQHAVAVEE